MSLRVAFRSLVFIVLLQTVMPWIAYSQMFTEGAVQLSKLQDVNTSLYYAPNGACREPASQPRGDFVVFSGVFTNFPGFGSTSSHSSNLFIYANNKVELLVKKHDPTPGNPSKPPDKLSTSTGQQDLTYGCYSPAVSKMLPDDQSYAVAFTSDAVDLVSEYTGSHRQVYVTFPKTGQTVLVSGSVLDRTKKGANGDSDQPTIAVLQTQQSGGSTEYKYRVCFRSSASDLINQIFSTPQSGNSQIFCVITGRDGSIDSQSYVSLVSGLFGENPVLSSDASALVFTAAGTNEYYQVYRYKFLTTGGELMLVSQDSQSSAARGHSILPSVSENGAIVAFQHDGSAATAGSTLSGVEGVTKPIFVKCSLSGGSWSCSQINTGVGNVLSDGVSKGGVLHADGRFAAFFDNGTNLLGVTSDNPNKYFQVYLKDTQLGNIVRASVNASGQIADRDSGIGDDDYLNQSLAVAKKPGDDSKYFVSFNSDAPNLVTTGMLTTPISFVYAAGIQVYTNTPTATPTSSDTPTNTPTNIATDTPTNTPTHTATDTPANTPSNTPSNTPTSTPMNTPTDTSTNTPTNIPTNTPTTTPTNTPTEVPATPPQGIVTSTPSETPTAPPTETETSTPTETATPSPTTSLPTATPFDIGSVNYATPIPISENVPISAPPQVEVSQRNPDGTSNIVVTLMRFKLPRNIFGRALFVSQAAAPKGKITYHLELRREGSKKRIHRVISRNTTTIRKLTPGRYTLRYKVVATKGNKRIQSRTSPPATFTLM